MSEKRFRRGESDIQGEMLFIDTENDKIYWQEYFDEIVDLVNEQQATIEQLERKLKKYAKIGEGQLKQIIELQDELQFFDKIINFFASNPVTKYSSKAELLEEMKIFEKNGWL